MQCPYHQVIYRASPNSTRKLKRFLPGIIAGNDQDTLKSFHLPKKAVLESSTRCTGSLIVEVTAIEEPYFGGCSPCLEVTWSCTEKHSVQLPDKYYAQANSLLYPTVPFSEQTINQYLQKHLDAMP
jgi:hypothetical protein